MPATYSKNQLITNKEGLVEAVKAEGSPGCSDHEMVDLDGT